MKRRQAGKSVIGNEVKSKISCLSYILVQGSSPECLGRGKILISDIILIIILLGGCSLEVARPYM